MRIRFQLPLLLLAATQLGATDCGQVLRDPGFDLWCGDKLCSWKVLRGDAKRVDTWHEGDSGVQLIGNDAAISQLTPLDDHDGHCIRFDLVANVSENAEARLDIDMYGDGSVEHSVPIPTSHWKPLSFKLRFNPPYTGVRFELAKRGAGTAIFANIGAETDVDCPGEPITANAAPDGAPCTANGQCENHMCREVEDPGFEGPVQRCVGCEAASCGSGQVCGFGDPFNAELSVPIHCVAAGADPVGGQCLTDAECASGICESNACSTCRTSCNSGETCGVAWLNGPSVCAPGQAHRTSGEACVTNGECMSGVCNGTARRACTDNRPCGDDSNCPSEGGLQNGLCRTVGVTGGTCQ